MATIQRFVAQQGLDTDRGGMPRPNVENPLANALVGLGGTVDSIGDMLQEKQQKRENFKAENGARLLGLELAQELENMDPGETGEGFHDRFVQEVLTPKRDAFLSSLPERLRPQYETLWGDGGPDTDEGAAHAEWAIRAAAKERDASYSWYDTQITETHEQLATAISINPDEYDRIYEEGRRIIEQADLPTAKRREHLQAWEEMAPIAHLNRMLEEDPEGVLKVLGANPSKLSPTTQFEMLKRAVIFQESGGRANAVSPAGALGLMQVMPGTAREIAKELGDTNVLRMDPAQLAQHMSNPVVNERYGSHYLKKMIRMFPGDVEAALIAYNGGPERAKAWLKANRDDSVIPAETANYYKEVLGRLPGTDVGIPKGSPDNATFIWVRDGGNEKLEPDDKRLTSVNPELRSRVATAFTAAGVPNIRIRSGFRDAKHNAKVGGASKSQHIRGNALDIDVTGLSREKRIQLIQSLSSAGVTGIGVYENSIHADLGGRRAWGPTHHFESVPKWAQAAISDHISNTAQAPSVGGRYAALPYDKREAFITSADQALTKRLNEENRTAYAQKQQLKLDMDNEIARIAETGVGSEGFDDTAIATYFGEDDYYKWLTRKEETQRIYQATNGMATMSIEEISERIEDYKAMPTSTSFASDQKIEKAVVDEADRITKLRATQPDQAALEFPDVKEAHDVVQRGFATGKMEPSEIQRFVQLMLDKQAEFNIPPDARAPITQPMAMEIGRFMTAIPEISGSNGEQVRASITDAYLSVQAIFGEYADEVILYALSEYKGLGPNTAELLTGYMEAIAAGGDPFRLRADRAVDMDQVESTTPGFFQRVREFFTGAEDESPVPAPGVEEGGEVSEELILRALTQLQAAGGDPEQEQWVVQRYGVRAVEAARARMGNSE